MVVVSFTDLSPELLLRIGSFFGTQLYCDVAEIVATASTHCYAALSFFVRLRRQITVVRS